MACHEVDLELLSIAVMTPAPFECAIIASIFSMAMSIKVHAGYNNSGVINHCF
jgi:hypothetical protein